MDRADATRLFLITPTDADANSFPRRLAEALGAGDVAAVLLDLAHTKEAAALAATLVPIVQNAGAAALIPDDTRLVGHLKADGVQVGTGPDDLRLATESFRPQRIVGAAGLTSRHAAMQAGELNVDYVFFGRPQGDTHDAPHPKALELAAWWAELMEVPAVVMAGRGLDGVSDASSTGAAFVAVNKAVWSHPGGPAEAVALAEATLRSARRAA